MQEILARVVGLMLVDPHAAANELDRLADQLREHAAAMRLLPMPTPGEAAQSLLTFDSLDGFKAPGGCTDRVKINVIGPDGAVKQHVDTGKRP